MKTETLMSNLTKVINQRAESLDKLKAEFNMKMRDIKELQNRWDELSAQDFVDRQNLLKLQQELKS
jgi:hypothetical protein